MEVHDHHAGISKRESLSEPADDPDPRMLIGEPHHGIGPIDHDGLVPLSSPDGGVMTRPSPNIEHRGLRGEASDGLQSAAQRGWRGRPGTISGGEGLEIDFRRDAPPVR